MNCSLRILGILILIALFSISLTACGSGGGGSKPTADTGSSVAFASIIVKDATGQNLGYFLGGSGEEAVERFLKIYSPSGYMYNIDMVGFSGRFRRNLHDPLFWL